MPPSVKSKLCLLVGLLLCCGCSSQPPRVHQIDADPADLAARLMAAGDTDQDGYLSQAELSRLPYLIEMAREYDVDRDSRIATSELAARFEKTVFDPKVALTPGACNVMRKGRPFVGATVRLVPAPWLQEYLPVASGIAGPDGIAFLSMDSDKYPKNVPKLSGVIRPGLYLIEVTHPSIQVPGKYNTATILGAEASTATHPRGPLVANLDF